MKIKCKACQYGHIENGVCDQCGYQPYGEQAAIVMASKRYSDEEHAAYLGRQYGEKAKQLFLEEMRIFRLFKQSGFATRDLVDAYLEDWSVKRAGLGLELFNSYSGKNYGRNFYGVAICNEKLQPDLLNLNDLHHPSH